MNDQTPLRPIDTEYPAGNTPKKKWGCLHFGGIGCFALLLVALGVAIGWFFMVKRGQKDVQLTAQEKTVVDQKIEFLKDNEIGGFLPESDDSDTSTLTLEPDSTDPDNNNDARFEDEVVIEEDDEGRRIVRFTQRELNGYFTADPQLREFIRVELNDDEVIARLRVKMPEGLPMAGKVVKVRGRVNVVVNETQMHASIESLTVGGIAVPSAVLGGLKGENLFEELFGSSEEAQKFREFVKELEVKNGEILIKLAE